MSASESKKVILIVEDEPSLRNVLRNKFEIEGFTVLEARHGEEGLKVSLREHPDLILLDIIMPVMDGLTMLTKLREDKWGKDARVIILTNLSDSEKVADAMLQNSYEYLIKSSWKIEEVVEKVKEVLKR